MEGSVKRDAFTARIDKSIESLAVEVQNIVGNMCKINKRLLPPAPTSASDKTEVKGPQGWLEEVLSHLGSIHVQVNALRGEVNPLFDAVEAGEVKGEPAPGTIIRDVAKPD